MKRIFIVLAALLAMVSCGPQSFLMNLELRGPSASGLELDGKSMAIVYLEDGSVEDSLYNGSFAEGLATALEKEYFASQQSVDVFSVVKKPGVNYFCKDSLVSLVMSLGADVVFLVDAPLMGEVENGRSFCNTNVAAYDSMDPADKIRVVRQGGNVSFSPEPASTVPAEAKALGTSCAHPFIGTWVKEDIPLIYFDDFNSDVWVNAILAAAEDDWMQAREIWLELATSRDLVKASSAAYNVAVACYVMRQYDLALEWLDLSDRNQVLDLSQTLRKRIAGKKGK